MWWRIEATKSLWSRDLGQPQLITSGFCATLPHTKMHFNVIMSIDVTNKVTKSKWSDPDRLIKSATSFKFCHQSFICTDWGGKNMKSNWLQEEKAFNVKVSSEKKWYFSSLYDFLNKKFKWISLFVEIDGQRTSHIEYTNSSIYSLQQLFPASKTPQ